MKNRYGQERDGRKLETERTGQGLFVFWSIRNDQFEEIVTQESFFFPHP